VEVGSHLKNKNVFSTESPKYNTNNFNNLNIGTHYGLELLSTHLVYGYIPTRYIIENSKNHIFNNCIIEEKKGASIRWANHLVY